MEPFRHHIFVCTQEKPEGVTSCPGNGSWRVLQALERELVAQELDDEVQVTIQFPDDVQASKGPQVTVCNKGAGYPF